MRARAFLLLAVLLLPAAGHAQSTGLRRVKVVREGGKQTRSEEPVPAKKGEGKGGGFLESLVGSILEAMINGSASAAEYSETRVVDISSAPTEATLYEEPEDEGIGLRRLEVRYNRTRLWTHLETNFQSASFTNLKWRPRPATYGWGPEAAAYFGGGTLCCVALRFGSFRGSVETNAHREGSLYVRETTRTEGYWFDGEYRHSFNRWLFASVALGAFWYRLETEIDSNAPSFTYDSLTADRQFGAAGIGAGVETPWRAPLKLFAAGNAWLPFGGEETSFESWVGQVSVGAAYRF